MKPDHHDDGPRRFARNWLVFDDNRPVRPLLLQRFIAVVAICFVVSALLALASALLR